MFFLAAKLDKVLIAESFLARSFGNWKTSFEIHETQSAGYEIFV